MAHRPLTPDEVHSRKGEAIPAEVIEVFNNLLIKNFHGNSAKIYQTDAVNAICEATGIDRAQIYKNKWLDIESLFAEYGWTVIYDSPAYNESYAAHWRFTKKK